ncbi:MAG: acyl-CoA thioesterase [Planctomycetes bacterium]|jgi:acyl-CoA thioester hydrolase|nr:acyl-CoA thioesterase [Planctomycetota bacterium]MCL4729459.1 acyl-CoA thioesterase [Planctomycetota bacterium]
MAYVSSYQIEVRSYELDVYDHVNNAVYINWLEHGRSRLLQDKGFNYTNIASVWGVRFMTVRTEIDYKLALKLGDRAEITTQVEKVGTTSVTIGHRIARLPGGETAAQAKVVIVYVDAGTGRPVPVPAEFVRLYA